MTGRQAVRVAAVTSLAVLLLVIGAALRPLVLPDRSAAEPVLDPVEIGYVQDMAEHHQQALAMTVRLPADVDPAVAALARQIGDAQRVEIGTLLGWLRLAQAPPTNPTPMSWTAPAGHDHGTASTTIPAMSGMSAMSGMASLDELDALAAAHGTDAEVLFLQLMLRHHLGGIEMARTVDGLLTDGPVRQSARSVLQEQGEQARLMTVLLAQRGAQPLP